MKAIVNGKVTKLSNEEANLAGAGTNFLTIYTKEYYFTISDVGRNYLNIDGCFYSQESETPEIVGEKVSYTFESYYDDAKVYIDGISPDNSKNVRIHDCDVETGDDGIVFKSSYTLNRLDICKDIHVWNCKVKSRCNAIKFGTETNGGFENILIENIDILIEYAKDLISYKGEVIALKELRAQAGWFIKGIRNGANFRRRISSISTLEDLLTVLDEVKSSLDDI